MMKKAILIDIDDCWMDSRLWISKAPLGSKNEEDWDLFYKRVCLCKPNKPFIRDVTALIAEMNLYPIFLTSRSNKVERDTIFQIQNNSSLIVDTNCSLYMRHKKNDYRSSEKVKKDILVKLMKNYEVVYAIDDTPDNLQMYKDMGIETVIRYNITSHDYERL
jgi:hypothetical protein